MDQPTSPTQATECLITLYHPDMPAARRFYEDRVGLEIREVTYDWYVGYWLTSARTTTLCISSSPTERARYGAEGRGVVVDLMVADVDELYRQLVQRGVVFEHPPEDFPWGLRQAKFTDPAGYTLSISAYTAKASG